MTEENINVDERLSRINTEYIKKGAEKVTDDDVKKVVDKADEIKDKFGKAGPLGRFVEDCKLLIALVKDFWEGNYREIPYWAITAVVFALLYVLSPVDLIPDVIPIIGYVDDAAVVALCLVLVEQELHDYKSWKTNQA